MDSRSARPIRRALAIGCLLLAVGTLVPTDTAAAARATRLALQTSSKQANVQRLNDLVGIIDNLRARLAADPGNTQTRNKLNAALAEYDALSASLGGDQAAPTATLPAGPGTGEGLPPGTPPNCTSSTSTFSSGTVNVPIPDNNAGVAMSTIAVGGVGPYLSDVNCTLNVTHTFNGDIDMTLTSPAGTVITLTSDNGGGNDNVFAGTTFDDSANPAGQIPYSSNNGLTTDHLYANLTVATPLVPEEGLGAFVGENPNGNWTLRATDDASIDTGTIVSWSVEISTLTTVPTNAPPVVASSGVVNVPIPDNNAGVAMSTVNVAGAGTFLCDVDCTVNVTHTFTSDVDMTLTSPSGTVVTLTTDNAGGNDNVYAGTTFDDDANPAGQIPYVNNNGVTTDHLYANLTVATPLTPEEALGAFIGENPNGTWTLRATDDVSVDTGTIVSWSISVTTCQCTVISLCSLTCPGDITTQATDLNGAVVNYPPPTASNCVNVVCTPPSGSTFPVGTTQVTCTGDDDVPEGEGPSTCAEFFDGVVAPAIPTGWTATTVLDCATSNPWATVAAGADTVPNVAMVNDPNCISDEVLDSVPIAVVSAAATVSFQNSFILEDTFDGGVLEISIGGGPFSDILTAGGSFVTGGYTDTISSSFGNPLAGRQAWSGNSAGFITTTVNLPASANGQNVVLRFRRGADSSVSGTGWTIDSLTTTGTNCGGGGGGSSSCTFNITVTIPFDACCVDDATGDQFRHVVASVPPTSPLYGYWEYEVAATSEIFAGIGNHVAYRPGLSIIIDDNDDPVVYCHAEIDFPRRKCRVQVRDIPTGRNFVLRDRNINNNMCPVGPPQS